MLTLLRLAWLDSRGMRRRLALYVSAMALGVAALVAIRSFGINLQRAVEAQAREVFGSDLQVRRDAPFTDDHEALLDSLARAHPGAVLRETTFPSMARFPEAAGGEGRTRLVQIRAFDGPWPLYGAPALTPATASLAEGALVDATLLLQMEAAVGDSVQVGGAAYRIAGRVDAVPGQTDIGAMVGPRVYLPRAGLDPTLLSFGSRARHLAAFRFDGPAAEAATESAAAAVRAAGLRYETAGEQQADVSEASRSLERFLSLVGFVALLLGGVGVASAMGLYVREKAETVATLRCLGLSSRRVFAVYVAQAVALGAVGAALGVALGVGVQQLLPLLLGAFLPVDVPGAVVPRALAEGMGVGVVSAVLFALLPLAGVRRVPPLRALRADARAFGRDPLQIALGAVLVAAVGGFAWLQTGSLAGAAGFVGGTAAVFALLALVAAGVRALVARIARPALPWAWRQGLANLAAPGNQTLVLLLTLGLGVFLVLALGLVQRSILDRIGVPQADGQAGPDLVLFDVQPSERAGVRALVDSAGLRVVGETPMVSMRLAAVRGVPTDSLAAWAGDDAPAGDDPAVDEGADPPTRSGRAGGERAGPPRWALLREYRSTYRAETTPGEEVTAGTWRETVAPTAAVVPVSLEADLASDLGVRVGDRLTWDVGGVPVESEITSLRRVDWARPQPNFFAVFPEGPLDEAPQTAIVLVRAGSAEASARLQSRLVDAFPTVSAVDVAQVLAVVDRVLGRVAWILRFMALFAVGTGLVVLAGAVRVALAQRTREAVLLRTLGASRAQVRRLLTAEYALLGLLAALTGGVLAVGGAWALARFAFEIPFRLDATWLVAAVVLVPALTAAIGLVGSRRAMVQPPLDVLREEG